MVPSASARHSFGDGLPSGRAGRGRPGSNFIPTHVTVFSRDVSMATHAKDLRPQDRDGVPDPSWKTGKRSSLRFLRENLGCLRGENVGIANNWKMCLYLVHNQELK